MTTTALALQRRHLEVAYVLIFEGLGLAFTTAKDAAGISAAWSGTPWQPSGGGVGEVATWYRGMFYPEPIKEEIELTNPRVVANSTRFRVLDPRDTLAAQVFGVASQARKTFLTEDLAPDDTAIPCQNNGAFTGLAGDYLIYIGNETILVNGSDFTGSSWSTSDRGKWALWETSTGAPFRGYHRKNRHNDLQPLISSAPRGFLNRGCKIYMHHRDANLRWSTAAEALLIWAGRVKSVEDDRGDRTLSFEATHITEAFNTQIFEEQFRGRIAEGRYFTADELRIYAREHVEGVINNEVDFPMEPGAGFYSVDEIIAEMNAVLREGASGLKYAWAIARGADGRVSITVKSGLGPAIPAHPGGVLTRMELGLHWRVWQLLGYERSGDDDIERNVTSGAFRWSIRRIPFDAIVSSAGTYEKRAKALPILYDFTHVAVNERRVRITDVSGQWVDQPNLYPAWSNPLAEGYLQLGDLGIVQAYLDVAASSATVKEFVIVYDATSEFVPMGSVTASDSWAEGLFVREGEAGVIEVRQIWWEVGTLQEVMLRLLLSTGRSGFNEPTYDVNPPGMGVGIPWEMLDLPRWRELDNVNNYTLLLNKPTEFLRLLESALATFGRHVVFRPGTGGGTGGGSVTLIEPKIDGPTIAVAWSLAEADKTRKGDIAKARHSPDGIINRIELKYDRDLGGGYKNQFVLEDLVSQSDFSGQKRAVSIEAIGIQGIGTARAFVGDLALIRIAAGIATRLAFFARPLNLVERTVKAGKLAQIRVGETVLFDDDYLVKPKTGRRGFVNQPAWVIGKTMNPAQGGHGNARLAYSAEMDVDKICAWAPTARVDHAASNAGYVVVDGSTRYLACLAFTYAYISDEPGALAANDVDISRYSAGDKLIVRELSPPDPFNPLVFHVTVQSIDTNSADPRIYLTAVIVGWDTSKKYIVTPDVIGTVVQAQKRDVFVSDDADNSTGALTDDAYIWGAGTLKPTSAAAVTSQQPVRAPRVYPNTKGYPLAVGDWAELLVSLNSIHAYRTRHHGGSGAWTHAASVTSGTTKSLLLVTWVPLYAGGTRSLLVNLRAKSSGGALLTLTVTASRTLPIGLTPNSVGFQDNLVGVVTVTTTSTSFTWLSELTLPCYPLGGDPPGVWVTVEGQIPSGTGEVDDVTIHEASGADQGLFAGAKPRDWGIANRAVASAFSSLAVAGYINYQLSHRLKVHAGWWTWASNPTDGDSAFRTRVYTSPLARKLRARVLLDAVRFAASAQPDPKLTMFVRDIDAGTPLDTTAWIHSHPFRDANIGPLTYRWVEWEWEVEGGHTYGLRMRQDDLLQVRGLTVWEVPRLSLTPSATEATTEIAMSIVDTAQGGASGAASSGGTIFGSVSWVAGDLYLLSIETSVPAATSASVVFKDAGGTSYAWSLLRSRIHPGAEGTDGFVYVFGGVRQSYHTGGIEVTFSPATMWTAHLTRVEGAYVAAGASGAVRQSMSDHNTPLSLSQNAAVNGAVLGVVVRVLGTADTTTWTAPLGWAELADSRHPNADGDHSIQTLWYKGVVGSLTPQPSAGTMDAGILIEIISASSAADEPDGCAADERAFALGKPIHDAPVERLFNAYRCLVEEQGGVLFQWCTQDGGQAMTIAAGTASLANIFDTAQVGYAAGARGFYVYPEKCGSFESDVVEVLLWAIVDWDNTIDAGERQVSFVDAGGTIGTIDLQPYDGGSALAHIALQARWSGAGALTARRKIDVLAKNSDASAMTVHAAGAYLKIPLDPRTISGLVAWFAADRITGLADGAAVAQWNDSSGNGNHAAQGTGANQPTYETNELSGKPCVRFDGTNDYLTVADSATYKAAALTVFVVAKRNAAAAGTDTLVGYPHAAASTSWRWVLRYDNAAGELETIVDNAAAVAATVGLNGWRVWSFSTALQLAWRDGVLKLDGADDSTITYPSAVGLYLGANGNAGETWHGDIAEVLVYSRALTDKERCKVELYLSEKYGLMRGFGDFDQ